MIEKALDSFEETIILDKKIEEENQIRKTPEAVYCDFEDSFLLGNFLRQRQKELFSTIIFSCAALESYINGYGIITLGKSVFQKLEKIRHLDKWEVFPKIACSNIIDKSREGWCLLRKLVSSRNEIIHDKPFLKKISDQNELSKHYNKSKEKIKSSSYDAIKTIKLLSDEILNIDKNILDYELLYGYNLKRYKILVN